MALGKSITLANNVIPTYWRVDRWTIDAVAMTAWYAVRGYLDKASATAAKDQIFDKAYTIALPGGTNLDTITQAYLYADAKTRVDFSGATDV